MKLHRCVPCLAALGGLVYFRAVRPWHVRWGATDGEISRAMPLDHVIERPTYVTNRAITIRAAPHDVWPWLAQMGELPRGGFYSYEWVERLFGMRVENAGRILPEYQRIEQGDVLDRKGTMTVRGVEPGRWLVLGPPGAQPFGDATWCLALYPKWPSETRLISRVRARINLRNPANLLLLALLDSGQFVMERKMLLLIKERVERAAAHAGRDARGTDRAEALGQPAR